MWAFNERPQVISGVSFDGQRTKPLPQIRIMLKSWRPGELMHTILRHPNGDTIEFQSQFADEVEEIPFDVWTQSDWKGATICGN